VDLVIGVELDQHAYPPDENLLIHQRQRKRMVGRNRVSKGISAGPPHGDR
jgi:hypothetical protein